MGVVSPWLATLASAISTSISVRLAQLVVSLGNVLGWEIPPLLPFRHPPAAFCRGLLVESGLAGTTDPVRVRTARRENRAPIVVVGCGCCLPGGAEDPSRFWQLRLIADGVAATQDISRWDMDAVVPPAGAAALHSLPQQPDRAGEAVDGRSVFIAPAICLDGPATDSSSLDSALREAHEPAPEWIDAEGNRSRPVFQWATSGSTGRPKVVVED